MPVRVEIIESERGWGKRIDDTIDFKTKKQAENYIKEFNKKNNQPKVPDWYMYARLQPKKEE